MLKKRWKTKKSNYLANWVTEFEISYEFNQSGKEATPDIYYVV